MKKQAQLSGKVVPLSQLTPLQKERMFDIFKEHYEQVSWEQYLKDLEQKDYVILLELKENEVLQGFSTQQVFSWELQGKALRVLFSGDTVIDSKFWGEQELVRSWCFFAGQILAQEPEKPLYWYLLSKGYRTYMYLPLFFKNFIPCYKQETPAFMQELLEQISFVRYPRAYQKEKGLLEFSTSQGHLKNEFAQVPDSKKRHPHVQFFLEKNPTYAQGTELICLAEISMENMRSFAQKYLEKGIKESSAPSSLS